MSALDHFRLLRADARTEIHDLTLDSRAAGEGSLFLALHGAREDGADYAKEAAARGAVCVVTEHAAEGVPCVLVPDAHEAAAKLAARWYGEPAGRMTVVGVTGTNGKTTTTYLLKQLLERCLGAKVGLIGTNQNMIGDAVLPAERTTPDALTLQRLLREMADAGCTHVVMEVSSHALVQRRAGAIDFALGVFTNLTQDHLDYHKTFENYFNAKKLLFKQSRMAVINRDDPYADRMMEGLDIPVMTFGIREKADVTASEIDITTRGVQFDFNYKNITSRFNVPIPGLFSVFNAIGAATVALSLGWNLDSIKYGLEHMMSVSGRLEPLPTGKNEFTVLLDYAHTPDALENVLKTVRGFATGRIVTLFGCGGDRDHAKRPIIGEIAGRFSDFAIVTSDNPRTENPMDIINSIVDGVKKSGCEYVVIENRREAIEYALKNARKNDVIILAGKGHENYQEINGGKHHFDEKEIVAEILGL